MVGLDAVADKRIGGFSLGMSQRLGIAAALLGDPPVLMFDEPVNGLDPEGIVWIRTVMRSLAGEGRTVLVSSHLMTEMAVTADHLLVVGKGRLLADVSTQEFIARGSTGTVRVRSPRMQDLARLLVDQGAGVEQADGALQVTGASCAEVGDLAARHGLAVHELVEQRASLESAFMEMTRDSVEYHAEAETPALTGGHA